MKLGIWSVLAVMVFAVLLTGAPAVLRAAHLHYASWPLALAGAFVTAVAGLVKPVADAVMKTSADRSSHYLENKDYTRLLEHQVSGRDRGLPTADKVTNRGLLGIHPSIPLPAGADASLNRDLPLYIPRDLDNELQRWITAHRRSGGFLLLVGPAASGKTRCAYELVREMLANWPIFMPPSADTLTRYFETNPHHRKLVVWLDESQDFLGPGGLRTATIRRILGRPRPVIIIGTIWPEHYDTLTSTQDIRTGERYPDSHDILTRLADCMDLRLQFSPAELERAERCAIRDPRITQALKEATNWKLTETLAATEPLISRWLNAADPCGAAVISAAVIARRCGHPEPLPITVLEPLAESVLTPADRGRATTAWFQPALDWARAPVCGHAAPLTPQAAVPGVIDGYQVSDVLVQYAVSHTSAPGHMLADSTWLLLIDHATPEACGYIAKVATPQSQAHQSAITELAFRKAANTKDARVMFNLGLLLSKQGRTSEAEE